ncbi:type I restriction enzyme HsdR N-terminal domain-containing protein [Alkalihalobacillus deserti]|uniref:type I restriction enzyme HsdR N-terminal domain-containing protein n=1 Tax=Alkalihalobacillus deserti TaxID=2879466 RepID=UPI001D14C7C7|nr:type I restriction enzyme HsdR N-terminal domain-containing protein [Alkalihalobacillus deserti]
MNTYKNKRKKLLYDPCRQIFLQHTPEEEVRQHLINYLINEMEIPPSAISTEYPLNYIDPRSRKRADIVVWNRDRHDNEQALLVLELKAKHIELTEHTLEQVKSYNNILKAKYVGVSNGKYIDLYEVDGENLVLLTDDIHTYSELLKGKVEYTKFRKLKRLPYDLTTYHRYVNHLLEVGYIGEGTPVEMHGFISELQNYILCGEILSSSKYSTSIKEDLSYGTFSFGNASGGNFPGYYRSFIVEDINGNHSIYRIGIFGTPIFKNDRVYGNRTGNSYLCVAVDQSGVSTHILQLNIDKFFRYNKDQKIYNIFHNGRRNGYTNKEVIDKVQQYAPELICNGQIYLGSLPEGKSFTSSTGSQFIERLLLYTSVREKLLQKKKVKKKRLTMK